MKDYEREEIRDLPDKYRPMGAWSYFGYQLLFMIPLIGFICLVIFALNDSNINRRSFARSYFCVYVIVIAFIVIMIVAGGAAFSGIMRS